jgi:hypothetical protein
MMRDPYSDPIVAALVSGNLPGMEKAAPSAGDAPHVRESSNPLIDRLLTVNSALLGGERTERTAERNAAGLIVKTVETKLTPETALAQGFQIVSQLTAAYHDMTADERLAANVAIVTFAQLGLPFAKTSDAAEALKILETRLTAVLTKRNVVIRDAARV